VSFGSSEDGWEDGTLIIELIEKGTEISDLIETSETLENKF
jgi:hypothetical protein